MLVVGMVLPSQHNHHQCRRRSRSGHGLRHTTEISTSTVVTRRWAGLGASRCCLRGGGGGGAVTTLACRWYLLLLLLLLGTGWLVVDSAAAATSGEWGVQVVNAASTATTASTKKNNAVPPSPNDSDGDLSNARQKKQPSRRRKSSSSSSSRGVDDGAAKDKAARKTEAVNNKKKAKQTKSDRDRGWPLWFPRTFSDEEAADKATDAAPTEKASVPTATQRNGGNEGDDSEKPPAGSTASLSPPATPLFRRKLRNETRILVITTEPGDASGTTGAQIESSSSIIRTTTSTDANRTTAGNDNTDNTDDATEAVEIPVGTQPINGTTSSGSSTEGASDTNATSETDAVQPFSQSEPSSPPPQQQNEPPPQSGSGGLILLRPGWSSSSSSPSNATPYRFYRRGQGWSVPVEPLQQQPPPNQPSPGRWGLGGGFPSSPASPNEERVIELATSVLATVTRLWLLRSISGWLAKQEESIAPTQHFAWERLNDQFVRDSAALHTAMQAPPPGCTPAQWRRHQRRVAREQQRLRRRRDRQRQRGLPPGPEKPDVDAFAIASPGYGADEAFTRTVVVVDLGGSDSKDGPDNTYLADVVSFLVQQHRRHAFGTNATTLGPAPLEVVWLVQSPGGSVASFGLAAAQVRRLSLEPGVRTTVCVDKYAASGGYMIASQAHQLVAAPFASVGSVGVILEGLNFHDVARKYGVQPLVLKSGDSKNPLTTFGPISKHDLEQQSQQLRKVHIAFQELVVQGRPWLQDNLDLVASGNVFLGREALELRLVDRLQTSSEYLLERVEAGDRVLKLHRSNPSRFPRRGVHLSPLDVLPHLRSFFLRHQSSLGPWMVQGATCLGFVRHVYDSYFR